MDKCHKIKIGPSEDSNMVEYTLPDAGYICPKEVSLLNWDKEMNDGDQTEMFTIQQDGDKVTVTLMGNSWDFDLGFDCCRVPKGQRQSPVYQARVVRGHNMYLSDEANGYSEFKFENPYKTIPTCLVSTFGSFAYFDGGSVHHVTPLSREKPLLGNTAVLRGVHKAKVALEVLDSEGYGRVGQFNVVCMGKPAKKPVTAKTATPAAGANKQKALDLSRKARKSSNLESMESTVEEELDAVSLEDDDEKKVKDCNEEECNMMEEIESMAGEKGDMALDVFGSKKTDEQKAVEALAVGDFEAAKEYEKHLDKDTLAGIDEKAKEFADKMSSKDMNDATKKIGKKASKMPKALKMGKAFF